MSGSASRYGPEQVAHRAQHERLEQGAVAGQLEGAAQLVEARRVGEQRRADDRGDPLQVRAEADEPLGLAPPEGALELGQGAIELR